MNRTSETEEIRIDNTVFRIKRTFTGEVPLEKIMTEWAVNKTIETLKQPEKTKDTALVVSH